ncbi:ATP-binding cassette sub-family B member 9-like [Branchiostoma floridae]|uniref:ABC-type oligopeptide transporter ABCB9 n=1 Tax=Branchiostoma floridae TaxID=7739 RepID=A0A9J7LY55_BRAFL|nr:ATP-binding cassette sub-family B member 9-like [Branchiostoma floridae]
MAGKGKTVAVVTILTLADLAANTVFYMNGADVYKFMYGINFFSIFTSMFDTWILGVLRVCLMFGAVLSVLCNARDAVPRIKLSRSWVGVYPAAVFAYTITKLLLYSEKEKDILNKLWFWAQFGGSLVGCVVFYLNWSLLSNIKTQVHLRSVNKEEGTEEEIRGLVGDEPNRKKMKSKNKKVKEEDSKSAVLKLMSYSKPDIAYLLTATAFLLGAAVSDIFEPYYTGQVIDGIAIEKSQEKFTRAIVIMTLLSIASSVCSGMRGGLFSLCMARLNIRLRNLLFKSVTEQEIGFFDSVKTGDITSRLTSDTSTMSDMLSLNLNIFLRSFVRGAGTLVFMFKLSWQLTIFTLVIVPVVAVVSKIYGKYFKKLSKAVQDSLAKANEVAEETIASLRTVRSFAHETGECDRYREMLKSTYKLNLKEALAYGGYSMTTHILDLTMVVLTLYYGGHLVITNRLTGGNLVSFILYQMELGDAIESMGSVYTGLMQAVGASEKVFEYIDRKPEIQNNGLLAPDRLEGHIEFKDVSFAYPARKDIPVLKDVSFKVSPGEVVALVGPSGSGKSTCVNLLEHFYETMSGQVLLDGNPIMAYDHKFLHRMISLVGQEPVLFARSIKDNISYALDNCSLEEVQRVARQANAHQFITELPEGYETETGEKGMQLSGGQKQRVAIARALIRKPAVLLLDEATSALDAESEHLVQQAINNLHGHTVIVIAHRLSTVEKADRIIVIDKGTVVEQGRHGELMQQDGLYAKLVQRQLLGQDDKENNSEAEKDEIDKRPNSLYGSMKAGRVRLKSSSSDSGSDSDSSVSSVEIKV